MASDLTPELLEKGRARGEAEGLDIEWVEADAEALPFEDGRFDRVLSAIGAMFAPRHDVTAAELARVCAPGGMVTMANWTPEGGIGDFFKIMGKHMPPPPPEASGPPVMWGSEDYVRGLFEPLGLDVAFDRGEVGFTVRVGAGLHRHDGGELRPAWSAAKELLGDGWPAVRDEIIELDERLNRATDGTMDLAGEYLIVMARKPWSPVHVVLFHHALSL